MSSAPHDLRADVEALPGMDQILAGLDGGKAAFVVGGAVRDVLRGEPTMDIDVVVEGPVEPAARAVSAALGGELEVHERFGTAAVRAGGVSVDLAQSRRERYPKPGALPDVEPAPIEEDLGRRDFSVNALAVALGEPRRGELLDLHHGREDLGAGVVRVLHPGSFVDDPTRLLRAVRYEARLGFAMDPETESLARAAIADRVSDTVSGSRRGSEVLLLLGEEHVETALERLVDLGLDRALEPSLAVDPALAGRAARAAPGVAAGGALAALAALVAAAPDDLALWLESLGLPSDARRRVDRAARSAPCLAQALAGHDPLTPSALRDLLGSEPREALALAVALGAPVEMVNRYTETVSPVRLTIDGDDLLAAGVEPSPAIGRALDETLRRKLDGEVSGRADELRVALALVHGKEETR